MLIVPLLYVYFNVFVSHYMFVSMFWHQGEKKDKEKEVWARAHTHTHTHTQTLFLSVFVCGSIAS